MNTPLQSISFPRVSLVAGVALIAGGLVTNWLWPESLPRAHAAQSNHAALAGLDREVSAKKKRKRKTKRKRGRRGGLGGDFEGGAGGSYHTNSLSIGPEKLAAP